MCKTSKQSSPIKHTPNHPTKSPRTLHVLSTKALLMLLTPAEVLIFSLLKWDNIPSLTLYDTEVEKYTEPVRRPIAQSLGKHLIRD